MCHRKSFGAVAAAAVVCLLAFAAHRALPEPTQSRSVYVSSRGYVGVGTTSPREQLDVRGNVVVSGGATVEGGAVFRGGVKGLRIELVDCGTVTSGTEVPGDILKLEATNDVACPAQKVLVGWKILHEGTGSPARYRRQLTCCGLAVR